MRSSKYAITALVLAMLPVGAGVGGAAGQAATTGSTGSARAEVKGPEKIANCLRAARFDPGSFPDVPDIHHEYLPMVPGTRLVLQGASSVTGELLQHTVTFTITDLVKEINGVASLVVYDVDRSVGVLTEAELAFFAQDDDGNVWNLGEYPEEYQDGVFAGAPSTWIAGQRKAEAGIHMLAEPELDGPRYLQGWAPTIHFLDCAAVIEDDATVAVPADSYDDVLVTDELNPYEPSAGSQQKYHAPGVGIVEIGFVDDPQAEVLKLVEHRMLSAEELAVARDAALELDTRAYEEASRVYGPTGPAATVP